MDKHRNPLGRLPKRPIPDNPDPAGLLRRLYDDLVEIEALAVTADECVSMLPVTPTGKHRRTLAKLYILVSKTAKRACAALERGEELADLRAAHVAALRAKRARAKSR